MTFRKVILALVALAGVGIAYLFTPPQAFPDRLAVISETETTIDNAYYNLVEWAESFQDADRKGLGSLHYLNQARIPYFVKIWDREVGDISSKRFLDVGCGGGVATNVLAGHGFPMDGIDIAPNTLKVAEKNALETIKDPDMIPTFKVGSCYDLPAPENSYDGVLMSDVLEHFHDLRTAIKEVKRVLKPGGVFVLDTINRTTFSWIIFILYLERLTAFIPRGTHDWRLFVTPDEVAMVLREEGFTMGPIDELLGFGPKNAFNPADGFETTGPEDLDGTYLWWARLDATDDDASE